MRYRFYFERKTIDGFKEDHVAWKFDGNAHSRIVSVKIPCPQENPLFLWIYGMLYLGSSVTGSGPRGVLQLLMGYKAVLLR